MKICPKCNINKPENNFRFGRNGLWYYCDECEKIRRQLYYQKQKKEKILFRCEKCNKECLSPKYCFNRRKYLICRKCLMTGKGNNNYKDGQYINSLGYRVVRTNNQRKKYKLEHVLVYEEFLGRELKTEFGPQSEQIHHIDGDKLNNTIDNLILCENMKEHKNIECQLNSVAMDLVKLGVIIFDKETKKYSINPNIDLQNVRLESYNR